MKNVKILGTGCAKCNTTVDLVKQVASAMGIAIDLEKIEDIARIVGLGIMSTPAVIVDGKLVHSGGVPERSKIGAWLS